MQRRRFILHLVALSLAPLAVRPQAAETPSLNEVVSRVSAYVGRYAPQFAVVAEERYAQNIDVDQGVVIPGLGPRRRVVKSDLVMMGAFPDEVWVAMRDAFEVDGLPVRDREDRLVELLSGGGDIGRRRAAAITKESARYNIGTGLIARNINEPTFVLQLLQGRKRERFKFSKRNDPKGAAKAPPDGGARWEIEYRERDRPTLVRQSGGGDQPLRGTISVDPMTGEVWRTHLTWERGPGGSIEVTFDRAEDIDVLVPVRMVENYRGGSTTIHGEATYSNFRQFSTSVRVVVP